MTLYNISSTHCGWIETCGSAQSWRDSSSDQTWPSCRDFGKGEGGAWRLILPSSSIPHLRCWEIHVIGPWPTCFFDSPTSLVLESQYIDWSDDCRTACLRSSFVASSKVVTKQNKEVSLKVWSWPWGLNKGIVRYISIRAWQIYSNIQMTRYATR